MQINWVELGTQDAAGRGELLNRAEIDLDRFAEPARSIIESVRRDGDRALARLARELDGAPVQPDALAASEEEFEQAFRTLGEEMLGVLRFAADRVRRFHEAQMPEEMWWKTLSPGVVAGERNLPIDSVACYVPRGKGAFPSVVMMTAIPAAVAGVRQRIILTPPGPDGSIDAATLVMARLAGVGQVYRCGGAQAVAAVAYGTETVPRCLKIVGPGSPWVLAAKRLLAHRIDPGPPAGPSEALVLADAGADGRLCALDLLNEAEHGPDSSAWLVTHSRAVAEAARAALPEFLARMGEQRVAYAEAVLGGKRGGILLTDSLADSLDFVNDYAPEHLQLHCREPVALLERIRNAGEILLGANTPICIGNFVLGPNAVLPTGRAARTASPLGVFDFLKRTSIGMVSAEGLAGLAPVARRFAEYEGFDAHANAVSELRREPGDGG